MLDAPAPRGQSEFKFDLDSQGAVIPRPKLEDIRKMKAKSDPMKAILDTGKLEKKDTQFRLPDPIKNTYDMTDVDVAGTKKMQATVDRARAAIRAAAKETIQKFPAAEGPSVLNKAKMLEQLEKNMKKAHIFNKTETMKELLERTNMTDVTEQMAKTSAPSLYAAWKERFNMNMESLPKMEAADGVSMEKAMLSSDLLEKAREAATNGRMGAAQRYLGAAYNLKKYPNYQHEGAVHIAERMEEGKPFVMSQMHSQGFEDDLTDVSSSLSGGRNSQKYQDFLRKSAEGGGNFERVDQKTGEVIDTWDDPSHFGDTPSEVERGLAREQNWKQDLIEQRAPQREAERLLPKKSYRGFSPPIAGTKVKLDQAKLEAEMPLFTMGKKATPQNLLDMDPHYQSPEAASALKGLVQAKRAGAVTGAPGVREIQELPPMQGEKWALTKMLKGPEGLGGNPRMKMVLQDIAERAAAKVPITESAINAIVKRAGLAAEEAAKVPQLLKILRLL